MKGARHEVIFSQRRGDPAALRAQRRDAALELVADLAEAVEGRSPGSAAGSGSGQCRRSAVPRKTGQTSSAQSVITRSTLEGSIVSTDFECWPLMSIPISAIAWIASGCTRLGDEPALWITTVWPERVTRESLRHLAARRVGDTEKQDPRMGHEVQCTTGPRRLVVVDNRVAR